MAAVSLFWNTNMADVAPCENALLFLLRVRKCQMFLKFVSKVIAKWIKRPAGAHKPEREIPILGLCHGVFTDLFIFRHILGHFFPRN